MIHARADRQDAERAGRAERVIRRSTQRCHGCSSSFGVAAALAIGLLSLTTPRESTGDYWLIRALPPLYIVSVGILAISFILAWRTRTRIPTPRRRAASSP
jgi:hypothetical protein